jgi:hypothetical protein
MIHYLDYLDRYITRQRETLLRPKRIYALPRRLGEAN